MDSIRLWMEPSLPTRGFSFLAVETDHRGIQGADDLLEPSPAKPLSETMVSSPSHAGRQFGITSLVWHGRGCIRVLRCARVSRMYARAVAGRPHLHARLGRHEEAIQA